MFLCLIAVHSFGTPRPEGKETKSDVDPFVSKASPAKAGWWGRDPMAPWVHVDEDRNKRVCKIGHLSIYLASDALYMTYDLSCAELTSLRKKILYICVQLLDCCNCVSARCGQCNGTVWWCC